MIVLALDTTTRAGSVAVVRDGNVLCETSGDAAVTHGQRLPTDLIALLGASGLAIEDVDLLAVAAGPGSFTGLRVGIATIQGLAMATGAKVVPVSTLEALARAGANEQALTVPWMDAQRGEVFAAVYDAHGRSVIVDATSLPPAATLAALPTEIRDAALLFCGDGALRYDAEIRDLAGPNASVLPSTPRLAGVVGQIACESPGRAVAPHAVQPIYVRRPDAEIARDRRAGAGMRQA